MTIEFDCVFKWTPISNLSFPTLFSNFEQPLSNISLLSSLPQKQPFHPENTKTRKRCPTIRKILPVAMAESTEESGDEASRRDSNPLLTKYEGHGRLVVDNEGNLDISVLPRMSGYMFKKGGAVNQSRGGFRNWKKRWFVLKPVDFLDHEGYELQYYDAPNGTLKGTVSLSGVELYAESKSTHKKVKFEFQIKLQTGGMLQLSVDSEQLRDEWLDSLTVVSLYLHKITTDSAQTLDGYDPSQEDIAFNYNLGHELALNCHAYGSGLFGAEAGQPGIFTIQIQDLVSQQVTRGGMPIMAKLLNAAQTHLYYCIVVDNENGTYTVQYTLASAGKYELSILINNEHPIFGSPFDISILPSKTLPRECTAEGEILINCSGSNGTITIIARDGFGNRKAHGGDPFEVGLMGPATLLGLEDNSDGTYTCTISLQPTGNINAKGTGVMILISLHGKPIQGSPFKPTMGPALNASGMRPSTPTSPVPRPYPASSPVAAAVAPGGSVGGSNAANNVYSFVSSSPSASATPTGGSVSSRTATRPLPGSVPGSAAPSRNPSTAASAAPAAVTVAAPAPAPAVTLGASTDGHPMSRLERSRQRALLAKGLSEGTSPTSPVSPSPMSPNARTMPMMTSYLGTPPPKTISKSLNLASLSPSPAAGAGTAGGGTGQVAKVSKLQVLAQRSAAALQAKQGQQGAQLGMSAGSRLRTDL